MTIALLGGTGRVSRYVIDELLAAGHTVQALTRNPMLPRQGVVGSTGDARDSQAVDAAVKSCDVVINCVGRLRNEDSFYSVITGNILRSMAAHGVRRYLLVTSSAVRLPEDRGLLGALGSFAFQAVFPRMVDDKVAEVGQIQSSGVDWTIFRLPLVLDRLSDRSARTGGRLAGLFVTNSQVARALVREIETQEHVRTSPFLFS